MDVSWYRDLYKIGSVAGATAVASRVTLAVGVPLVGGVLAGHPVAGVAGGATALFVTLSDIGTTPSARLVTMLAGWIAIAGGGTLGHVLGSTAYGREAVVLLCALVAGWASASHPAIAAVTRFFAIAALRAGQPGSARRSKRMPSRTPRSATRSCPTGQSAQIDFGRDGEIAVLTSALERALSGRDSAGQ